jgi:hypothetical protein
MKYTISRRLDRLEPIAIAEGKRREAWLRQAARDHATQLVALILHGDPKIDEPLSTAWRRALSHLDLVNVPDQYVADRLSHLVVAALPGDSENDKYVGVLSSAPSWLRHFCMARLDAFALGIELPKISEPLPACGRDGLRDMRSWPDLPSGTIGAGRPMPKPNPFEVLNPEELVDLIRIFQSDEDSWSFRDRRRCEEIMSKVDGDELSRALMSLLDQH